MATTDPNLQEPILAPGGPADLKQERELARKLAERYRCGFNDLLEQRIDPELFRTIQADLMFRYNFVPLVIQNNTLVIAVADPSQVLLSDELPLLLGKKLSIKVATPPPDQRSPEAHGAIAKSARAGHRSLHPTGFERRRRGRRDHIRRPPHSRYHRQPGCSPGGNRHLHCSGAPRQ